MFFYEQVLTEEETSRALTLEEQVQALEDTNSDLEKKLKVTHQEVERLKVEIAEAVQAKDEEYQHRINTLTKSEHDLSSKVKDLSWKVVCNLYQNPNIFIKYWRYHASSGAETIFIFCMDISVGYFVKNKFTVRPNNMELWASLILWSSFLNCHC